MESRGDGSLSKVSTLEVELKRTKDRLNESLVCLFGILFENVTTNLFFLSEVLHQFFFLYVHGGTFLFIVRLNAYLCDVEKKIAETLFCLSTQHYRKIGNF